MQKKILVILVFTCVKQKSELEKNEKLNSLTAHILKIQKGNEIGSKRHFDSRKQRMWMKKDREQEGERWKGGDLTSQELCY